MWKHWSSLEAKTSRVFKLHNNSKCIWVLQDSWRRSSRCRHKVLTSTQKEICGKTGKYVHDRDDCSSSLRQSWVFFLKNADFERNSSKKGVNIWPNLQLKYSIMLDLICAPRTLTQGEPDPESKWTNTSECWGDISEQPCCELMSVFTPLFNSSA